MVKVGVQKEKLFEVHTSKNFQLLRHGFRNIFLVIYISHHINCTVIPNIRGKKKMIKVEIRLIFYFKVSSFILNTVQGDRHRRE